MKAGPKAAVDPSPLDDVPGAGADRVAAWVEEFCVAPKGRGAREPMEVRPWQRELLACFDEPRPSIACWSLPRGSGKTTLSAALALYALHADGVEGARVVVVATDERQARLAFDTARRMTELSEPLLARTQVFKEKLVVPGSDSALEVLPAQRHHLEGLDLSFAIVDEVGFVKPEVWETILHGTGKRPEGSMVLAIGTPSPPAWWDTSPMRALVTYARDHPEDASVFLAEHGAPPEVEVTDEQAWEQACPGLDDLVSRDTMRSLLPPKTREGEYRRARLGTWVTADDGSWLPPGAWDACCTGEVIEEGAEVVLALDGSFSQDATGLVVATVGTEPHLDTVAVWEPPPDDPDYRVPVADAEQAIRDACRRWQVREVTADPFRWQRSLQALEAEGLPMVEFPQSPARMTPATTAVYEAVVNGALSHSGEPTMARHVANARVIEDARGTRLRKDKQNSPRKIDLAVCAVMAHSRATWHATKRPRRRVVALR